VSPRRRHGTDEDARQRGRAARYPGERHCWSARFVSDQIRRRHAREGANTPFEDSTSPAPQGIPVGRMGKAEEFAAMACFLCSDHAGFTTGTAITWTGGASPVV